MKKNLFTLLAFAGLLSTACVKPIDPEVPESKEPVFSLFVNGLETKAETKVAYQDGIGLKWSNYVFNEGYKEQESPIGLVGVTSSENLESSEVKVYDKDGNLVENGHGPKVSFGFASAPSGGDYYAYQPYNSDSSSDNIIFTVSGVQRQENPGLMDVRNGSRLPCISTDKITIEGSATSKETSFKATAAILRFFVYDSNGNSEKIYSVKFKAKNPVAGTITCKNDGTQFGAVADEGYEVKVVLSNLAAINNNTDTPEGMGIYLVALPCTTTGYTYEVETITGRYIFESTSKKELEAGKIYDVKLNLSNSKARKERRAPYFVGSTNPSRWTVPGTTDINGPLEMNPVEGVDGLFTLEVDWKNYGGDFKFLAFNDRWQPLYYSSNSDKQTSAYGFNKFNVFAPIVYSEYENHAHDNNWKWSVGGYDCETSVIYIFDANKNKLTCVPQFALAGGNWDGGGWLADFDNDWDKFAKETKMSLDPVNMYLYKEVTLKGGNADFKFFSVGTKGWEHNNGVWIRSNGQGQDYFDETKGNGKDNSLEAYVRKDKEGDEKFWTAQVSGKVRICLDFSAWNNEGAGIKVYYTKID